MNFDKVFDAHPWENVEAYIRGISVRDVESALSRVGKMSPYDFLALLSPEAKPYLEEMAQLSFALTRKRFGKTIQMYAPLYLSNECSNICTYCGFRYDNDLKRKTLSDEEILAEAHEIKRHGFDHLLLVTGEAQRTVGMPYFLRAIELLRPLFSNISFEVQPLDQPEYETLSKEGVHSVLVYQETYNEKQYRVYHPKGKKSNFRYRLETPERIGRAGIHKTGIGVLLGLEDWRVDSFFVALHLAYLRKTFWKTKYSLSFPRLRPAEGYTAPNSPLTDSDFVQLLCAFRLFDENVELSLSTRENPTFREHLLPLGITTTSAGSKTEPGGYTAPSKALKQFEISDERSAEEFAEVIRRQGLEPVWKDWDRSFQGICEESL